MKYYELDSEEKQMLKDFEEGKYKRAKKVPLKKNELKKSASKTLGKSKNINIRLSQKDLLKIKSKAAAEGIPYQTMVSSILHRSVQSSSL